MNFTQEFFDELEQLIKDENDKSGKGYTSLAMSQAKMSFYFTDSDYSWENVGNVSKMIDEMNAAPARFGMYSDYKKLTGVSDYAYYYEQQYDTKLTYGGYINRSRGCYVLNISGHIQTVWNNYLKEKAKTDAGKAVDLTKVEGCKVYIAPEAYSLYTPSFGVVQGMNLDNTASIRIDLTYTLIKDIKK